MDTPFLIKDENKMAIRQWNNDLYQLISNDTEHDLDQIRTLLFNFKGDSDDTEYRIYFNMHLRSFQELQAKYNEEIESQSPFPVELKYPHSQSAPVPYQHAKESVVFLEDDSFDELVVNKPKYPTRTIVIVILAVALVILIIVLATQL